MFSCGVWNVNSWTTKNKSFRKNLLSQLNFDIVGIVESKLKSDSVLELTDYTWFGHNRTDIRRNDNGSGGVGLFVKSELFQQFEISVFDKCFRDVLCVEFIDKTTHLKFAICVYYLPPENNVNGRFTADFFDYLTNLL